MNIAIIELAGIVGTHCNTYIEDGGRIILVISGTLIMRVEISHEHTVDHENVDQGCCNCVGSVVTVYSTHHPYDSLTKPTQNDPVKIFLLIMMKNIMLALSTQHVDCFSTQTNMAF